MIAERVRSPDVARMTGLSVRAVQLMAARGDIPGAARLGKLWTFDPSKVRRWIVQREDAACQGTSIGAATSGGDVSRSPVASIDEAYERLIGKRRPVASRSGSRRR
jgi:predicted DNA-binding transcriptional regulator AlpA